MIDQASTRITPLVLGGNGNNLRRRETNIESQTNIERETNIDRSEHDYELLVIGYRLIGYGHRGQIDRQSLIDRSVDGGWIGRSVSKRAMNGSVDALGRWSMEGSVMFGSVRIDGWIDRSVDGSMVDGGLAMLD